MNTTRMGKPQVFITVRERTRFLASWLRRSKTRPVGRSESDPPEGSSFYAFLI
jgi:hypothetical protein